MEVTLKQQKKRLEYLQTVINDKERERKDIIILLDKCDSELTETKNELERLKEKING